MFIKAVVVFFLFNAIFQLHIRTAYVSKIKLKKEGKTRKNKEKICIDSIFGDATTQYLCHSKCKIHLFTHLSESWFVLFEAVVV